MIKSKMHKMTAFKHLRPVTLLKKEILAQVFSCEFFQFFKNTFLTELLRVSTSILRGGRRLKQIEISIISKLHKENNNNKKCSNIFYFLLVVLILFLFGLHFLQRGLMFHYIHTFIMFKHVEFGKHTWIHTQKLKKIKIHPGMKCLHVFFSFFHPRMKFPPCLSSGDKISSRPKCVNSKRHFTIDRHDFILGRVSSRDKTSRVNTL